MREERVFRKKNKEESDTAIQLYVEYDRKTFDFMLYYYCYKNCVYKER